MPATGPIHSNGLPYNNTLFRYTRAVIRPLSPGTPSRARRPHSSGGGGTPPGGPPILPGPLMPPKSPQSLPDADLTSQPDPIIAWFAARNIRVLGFRQPDAADATFDEFARTLGDHFVHLDKLHAAIRRALPGKRSLTLHLGNTNAESVRHIDIFCRDLKKCALLTDYHYDRKGKKLHLTPQHADAAHGFFTGGWFERYTHILLHNELAAHAKAAECRRGVKIELPDGRQRELDLFALIDGQPLWVECKTGKYEKFVRRYGQLGKDLNIPAARALMVILSLDAADARRLSALWKMTFISETGVRAAVRRLFDPPARPAAPSAPSRPPASPQPVPGGHRITPLGTFFRKVNMRPQPEIRGRVLAAVLGKLAGGDHAYTFNVLKVEIADALDLSRSQVNDVLIALQRGGALLAADGAPLDTTVGTIAAVAGRSVADLEQFCVKAYNDAVVRADAAFLASAVGQALFQAEVLSGTANATQ